MKYLGVIPARWGSSRLPGKPLADIGGMSMIERVYRRASSVLSDVIVATDDVRVYDEVVRFGGRVVITSPLAPTGTARVYEAYTAVGADADVVINIQGDEPFIDPEQIRLLMSAFENKDVAIATLARRFNPDEGWDALFSPDTPKVVMNSRNEAMYFSRSIIPYVRGVRWEDWIHSTDFYLHIGLYGYKADVLAELVNLTDPAIRMAESLEQLAWLHAGIPIKVMITDAVTIGVDTQADLQRAIEYCKNNND
ncbi:MAG: 3-deoxy-manno-octulosonate cytidylyltransferase [Muribaculum sp.]|nr:3-deoxy-manno-octulosonate cytidylyltransferase [Muribaculum sp.]